MKLSMNNKFIKNWGISGSAGNRLWRATHRAVTGQAGLVSPLRAFSALAARTAR